MTAATKHVEPDWDIDLAFGEDTERSLIELFNAINLRHTSLEVKDESRQALSSGNVYIEFAQTPRGQQEKKSGIATSSADWYAIHFGSVVLLAQTESLRHAAREHSRRHPDSIRRGGRNGDNPTRGVLIPLNALLSCINAEPFGEHS